MKLFITGRPGSGKSRLCALLIEELRKKGFKVGGVLCPEAREKRGRVGFRIIDLLSGREGTLAWIGMKGPRISKYGVNLKDIEEIGAKAIEDSLKQCDVTVVDEYGPMEVMSERFVEAVKRGLASDKPMIIVVHRRKKEIIKEAGGEVIDLDELGFEQALERAFRLLNIKH